MNVERIAELKSALRIRSRVSPSTRLHITANPTTPAALVLSLREAGTGAVSVARVDMERKIKAESCALAMEKNGIFPRTAAGFGPERAGGEPHHIAR